MKPFKPTPRNKNSDNLDPHDNSTTVRVEDLDKVPSEVLDKSHRDGKEDLKSIKDEIGKVKQDVLKPIIPLAVTTITAIGIIFGTNTDKLLSVCLITPMLHTQVIWMAIYYFQSMRSLVSLTQQAATCTTQGALHKANDIRRDPGLRLVMAQPAATPDKSTHDYKPISKMMSVHLLALAHVGATALSGLIVCVYVLLISQEQKILLNPEQITILVVLAFAVIFVTTGYFILRQFREVNYLLYEGDQHLEHQDERGKRSASKICQPRITHSTQTVPPSQASSKKLFEVASHTGQAIDVSPPTLTTP